MNYEELKREAAKYPDILTDAERNKLYAQGEEVDRIPIGIGSGETQAHLYGYTLKEFRDSAEVQIDIAKKWKEEFGTGNVVARLHLSLRGMGRIFGATVKSPENEIEYIETYPLEDYSQLDEFKFEPEKNEFIQSYIKKMDKTLEIMNGNCPILIGMPGPMTAAFSVRMPDLFLRDMGKDKENAHRLLEKTVEWGLQLIRYVKERYGDATVSIADPCTAANLIGRKFFLEFSKPYLRKYIAGIEEITSKKPSVHICGKTKPIWKDLEEIGVTSFSVDNCEDLAELKEAIGDNVFIAGNVAPVDVMLKGTIDDVIESVKECLLKGSDSPAGYSLSMGCELPIDTPRENIEAFLYAGRKYGRGARKGCLCKGLYME